MKRNSKTLMTIGAISALASVMLMPSVGSKTRRRVSRSTRNAYYRLTDFLQDMRNR